MPLYLNISLAVVAIEAVAVGAGAYDITNKLLLFHIASATIPIL
jgi:hypothetical protein